MRLENLDQFTNTRLHGSCCEFDYATGWRANSSWLHIISQLRLAGKKAHRGRMASTLEGL